MAFRRLLLVLICFFAAALSGCSRLHFAYNHIGWFVLPKIKSYTAFNADQRRQIDLDFAAYMSWHRHAMLLRYASLLHHLAAELDAGSAAKLETMHELRKEFQSDYERTVEPTLGPTARILVGLNEAQLEGLEKTFAEEDAASRKRFAGKSLDEKIAERDRNIIDGIEDWSGNLSQGQKEVLGESLRQLPYLSEEWVELRKKNRAELVERLRLKQTMEEIEGFLKSWMVDGRRRYPKVEAAVDQLMVEVAHLLNDRQRERFRKKLLKFAQDFEELAREGNS